ncbi:MAG: serine hydrolase, partial [Chthoniobacterales bacterium]
MVFKLKPLLCCILLSVIGRSFADFREFQSVSVDADLHAKLGKVAEETLQQFPRLTSETLAISVIDLTNAEAPLRADYHGDASFYPASVMKLFVMTQIFQEGRRSPEIERALREMIHVSDNDATAYLMDVLSGTTGGPELEGRALEEFIDRRRTTNRYFATLGYDISAMMKPWSFGPYGREMQLLGENKINRNRASANTFASLLYWIVRKRAVSPAASEQMLALLVRPLENRRPDENQVNEFLGESFAPGTKLWSKSGDTSEVRHDAAYVELPNGKKLI